MLKFKLAWKCVTAVPDSGQATVPSPCHWPLLRRWNPKEREKKEITLTLLVIIQLLPEAMESLASHKML